MDWAKEYTTVIHDCDGEKSKLSDWDKNFLKSLNSQIDGGRTPTQKQIQKLDEIWERAEQQRRTKNLHQKLSKMEIGERHG